RSDRSKPHLQPDAVPPDARKTLHSAEGDLRTEQFLRDLNALFLEAIREGGDPAFLQRVLDAGLNAVGGRRGFLALVQFETGELHVACTSGQGWNKRYRA